MFKVSFRLFALSFDHISLPNPIPPLPHWGQAEPDGLPEAKEGAGAPAPAYRSAPEKRGAGGYGEGESLFTRFPVLSHLDSVINFDIDLVFHHKFQNGCFRLVAVIFLDESDFLSGRNGHWRGCAFDWLINKKNAMKVLEGTYANRKAGRCRFDYSPPESAGMQSVF